MRYVVLDLDSTLVYSRPADLSEPIKGDERNFYVQPFDGNVFHTTTRKHLTFFLDELKRRDYKVIVWSAGSATYVKDIVSIIFRGREDQIHYLFTNIHLTDGQKVLNTIGEFIDDFDVSNARLIDDNPQHSKGQEEFFIPIKDFTVDGKRPTPEEDDDELETLADRIDESFRTET